MMFDPDLLKAFVAVAEHSGFTKAAAVLNSTQSTVSAQIRRLEEAVGRELFLRNTRSVQLTSAGETLIGYARTVLRLEEDARMRMAVGDQPELLRLGSAEDLAETWLPDVLQAFALIYPNVKIELEIGLGVHLFEKLDRNELDLAVGGACTAPHGRTLWADPLVWVAAADAAVPAVLPLAFFPEPCPYREAALRSLAEAQIDWRIACTSSSLAGIRATVRAGLAVTPLPRNTVGPNMRIVGEVEGMPKLPSVEFVVKRRADAMGPASSTFEALLVQHAL